MTLPHRQMLPELRDYIDRALPRVHAIPEERKRQLEDVAAFVSNRHAAGEPAELVFICTHNSRRSHMGQLWAAAAAAHFGVEGVVTYSGGTEVTAFNPRAVAAMERAGFAVEGEEGTNPRYRVTYSEGGPALECCSKAYDHPFNPREGFAAIMTCSDADEACPVVVGAELRVPITYDDPKAADGTPEEASTYDARCLQIATEMLYLFSQFV